MTSTFRPRAAKALLMLILLGALGPTIAACNTTAGAGQDISKTGDALTNAAERNKPQ
jgi:predicted small secreted protein